MDIRRLTPADVVAYRQIMLQAYATEPEAFTSTVSERQALPLEWWARRVADGHRPDELVVGAFVQERLAGVAGLRFEQRQRIRHKVMLYGVFVLPEYRGSGIGRALLQATLDEARAMPGTRVLELTVAETNASARRLYESFGFRAFGTEPFALAYDHEYVALVHMWREFGPDGR